MQINLTIVNFTGVVADSYNVRYARIDNIASPVFIPAGSKTSAQFPYSISNIPNGQYEVGITPVYADGRVCSEIIKQTSGCVGILALNAVVNPADPSTFLVTYTAPGTVPQVYLTVIYPNGGSFTGAYTNGANGSTILVPVPAGVNGQYQFYMQSICDPDTAYYSNPTPPVNVNVSTITVNITSSVGGATITSVNGISGYALSAPVAAGGRDSGTHDTFTGAISVTFTGTPVSASNAVLYVDNIQQQSKTIPLTSGGTVLFDSSTYFSTNVILISFQV